MGVMLKTNRIHRGVDSTFLTPGLPETRDEIIVNLSLVERIGAEDFSSDRAVLVMSGERVVIDEPYADMLELLGECGIAVVKLEEDEAG